MMKKKDAIIREASRETQVDDVSSRWTGRATSQRIARWLPWLVLCVGCLVTARLWQNERDNDTRHLQTRFDSLARQTDALITERMQVYEQVMFGAKGLFVASSNVTRKEFHDYVVVLRLEEHYPGIQGIGFSLLVPASEKSQHIDSIRSEGFPEFVIQPEGKRDMYTSVVYLEPFNQRNRQAFGYDMYSDKTLPRAGDSSPGLRHAAMAQARDTGKAVVSGKVHLLMEMDSQVQAGFLMYLPVYKSGLPINTLEERRANLLGWVYAPFRVDDLMTEIIGERRKDMLMEMDSQVQAGFLMYLPVYKSGLPINTLEERRANLLGWVYAPFRVDDLMTEIIGERRKDIELKIYDGKEQRDAALMYVLGNWSAERSSVHQLERKKNLTVAGRDWSVVVRSVPGFGSDLVASKPQIIATTGAIMSVLFALLTWMLAASRTRAMQSAGDLRQELMERKKVQHALREAEAFSRATIDAISEQICVIDQSGLVLSVNTVCKKCGVQSCPAISCEIGDNYFLESEFVLNGNDEKLNEIRSGLLGLIHGEQKRFRFEYAVGPSDSLIYFSVNATRFSDDKDNIVIVQEDVTERIRSDELLKLAASVYENVTEAITVTDANCNIIAVNPAFTQITGYAASEVIGKNPSILQSGRHDRTFYQEMWRSLNATGRWQGEIWNHGKNGEMIAEWISICAIYDVSGAVDRYVAVFSNITEKKKMEKLVWDQANFDALTSLPNRLLFLDRLSMEISKSASHALSFGLLFIDLDNFKEVNETLGHHIGDKLLIHAAQRVSSCLRVSDTIGRLGGDEFAVLMTDVKEPAKIETAVQEILDRLAEPFLIGDERVYLTASIGITLYPEDAIEPSDLFRNADQALYVAKNAGRNRFSYFTKTMEASAKVRLQTLNDLRGAIDAEQLKVFFQPIIDLSNNKVMKAEALLRWFHPKRGMISPAEFIPLAEESGLINDIGDWVFKESALWARRWSKQIGQAFQISVNKSPVQFHAQSKYTSWTEYLQMLGLPGNCISVEITEGLLLNAAAEVSEKLLEYSNAGIQVSIDDFGTGYSSMSYLKKFHIDYLKIDQSFVRDMENDEADRAIAEAIIVMAHKLGCKVIAEGIETEGQRDLLMAAGCDFGQGYLFSKAISPSDFESLFIHTAYSESIL